MQGDGIGRRAGCGLLVAPEVEVVLGVGILRIGTDRRLGQLGAVVRVGIDHLLVGGHVGPVLDEVGVRGRDPAGLVEEEIGRGLCGLGRPHLVRADDSADRVRRLRGPRCRAAPDQIAVRAARGRELTDDGVEVVEAVCLTALGPSPGGAVDGELRLERQRPFVDVGDVDRVLVSAVRRIEAVLQEAVVLERVAGRGSGRVERVDTAGRGDRQSELRALNNVDPVPRGLGRGIEHGQRHRGGQSRLDLHRAHPVRRQRGRFGLPRGGRNAVVRGLGQVVDPDRIGLRTVVDGDRRGIRGGEGGQIRGVHRLFGGHRVGRQRHHRGRGSHLTDRYGRRIRRAVRGRRQGECTSRPPGCGGARPGRDVVGTRRHPLGGLGRLPRRTRRRRCRISPGRIGFRCIRGSGARRAQTRQGQT